MIIQNEKHPKKKSIWNFKITQQRTRRCIIPLHPNQTFKIKNNNNHFTAEHKERNAKMKEKERNMRLTEDGEAWMEEMLTLALEFTPSICTEYLTAWIWFRIGAGFLRRTWEKNKEWVSPKVLVDERRS